MCFEISWLKMLTKEINMKLLIEWNNLVMTLLLRPFSNSTSFSQITRRRPWSLKVFLTQERHAFFSQCDKYFQVKSTYSNTKAGLTVTTRRILSTISQDFIHVSFKLMRVHIVLCLNMALLMMQKGFLKAKVKPYNRRMCHVLV